VKSDGSVSFFAELEKSSADREKRIEQAREDKKAQKKEDEKEAKTKKLKEQQEDRVKRSVVRGDTASELIKNIREVDWDKVAEEVRLRAGGKIDFGV
jgi:predicted Holliday junction resolvase-like endonuclease